MRARRGRAIAPATLAISALLLGPSSSEAATPASFSCTASAITVQALGASTLKPVRAGGAKKACQPAIAGLPNLGEALSLSPVLKARTAYAAVDPAGARPVDSKPTAAAGVEGLELTLGNPVLAVGAARSAMTASCVEGAPVYVAASEVASITLAGQPIVLDGVLQPITDAVTDAVGALVAVELNEVVDLPDGGQAVRAAHITLLRDSTPLADVVIAESRLGVNGDACDPKAGGNTPPTEVTPCPPGSVLDVTHDTCVIPAPGTQTPTDPTGDITGPDSVVIGPSGTGPVGGTVVHINIARKRYKSSCLKGKGPRYAVIGTKGSDRITGTNRRDRILARAGRDRVDAGRRDDCIDGQAGKDRLTGGQGRDKVIGGKARDIVSGDGGTDRLIGGRGNDSLSAGYGQGGWVRGGKGRDRINIATSGRRTKVWGGPQYDRVWCQRHEVKFLNGVEWVKATVRS